MYSKKTIEIGEFTISTNTMYISDPCYKYGGFGAQQIPCISGKYKCYIVLYSNRDIGTRVGESIVRHIAYKTVNPTKLDNQRLYVDSGQLGYFDMKYYEKNNPGGLLNIFKSDNEFYKKCCEITLSKKEAGIVDNSGFVTSSGLGDGEYKFYLGSNPNGKTCAIKVVFIE